MTIDFSEYVSTVLHKNLHGSKCNPLIFLYVGKSKLSVSPNSDKNRLVSIIIERLFKKVFPDIMKGLSAQNNRITLLDVQVIVDGFKSQESHIKSLLCDSVKRASYKEAGKAPKVLADEIYHLMITNSNHLINKLPLEDLIVATIILRFVISRSLSLHLDYIKETPAYKLLYRKSLEQSRHYAQMRLFSHLTNVMIDSFYQGVANALQDGPVGYMLRKGLILSETTFLDLDDIFFNQLLPLIDLSQLIIELNKSIKEELKKMFERADRYGMMADCMELFTEMQKANLDEIADKMLTDILKLIYESTANQELRNAISLSYNPSAVYHLECMFNLRVIYKYSKGIKSGRLLLHSNYLRCTLIEFFNNSPDIKHLIDNAYSLFDYHGKATLSKEKFQLLFPDIALMVMIFYISLESTDILLEHDCKYFIHIADLMQFLTLFCESREGLQYTTSSVLSGATRWMILNSFDRPTEWIVGDIDLDKSHIQTILDRMCVDDSSLCEFFKLLYHHLKENPSCSAIAKLTYDKYTLFIQCLNSVGTRLSTSAVQGHIKQLFSCQDDFKQVLVDCCSNDRLLTVIRYELITVIYHMSMNHIQFVNNSLDKVKECILANVDEFILMVDNIVVRQVYKFLRNNVLGSEYRHIFDCKNPDKERNIIMSYVLFLLNILFVENKLTPEFLGFKGLTPICGLYPPLLLMRSTFELEDAFKASIKECINNSLIKSVLRVINGKEALISAINMIDEGCIDNDEYKSCIASIILTRIIMSYTFKNILHKRDFKSTLYDLECEDKLLLLFNSVSLSVFNMFLYKTCVYNNNALIVLGLCRNKGAFKLDNSILLKVNSLMADAAFMQNIELLSEECFNAFKIQIIPTSTSALSEESSDSSKEEEISLIEDGATALVVSHRKRRSKRRVSRKHVREQQMLALGEEKAAAARKKEAQLAREEEERLALGKGEQLAVDQDACLPESGSTSDVGSDSALSPYTDEEQVVISVFVKSIPSLEGILGCKFSEEQRENLIKEHIKIYHETKVSVRSQNAIILHSDDEKGGGISSKDDSVEGKISVGTEIDESCVEDLDSIWEDGSISSKSMKRLNDEASSAPNISFFWNQAFEQWLEAIMPAEKNLILGKFKDMQYRELVHHKPLVLHAKHRVYEFKIINQYRIYFILINKNVHIIHSGDKKNQKVFLERGIHACLAKWMNCNSHICQ